jgi:dienelactone hydrolase
MTSSNGQQLPRWQQRFSAPTVTLPGWADDAPDRLVYSSNLSGAWQVHAWDRQAGTHRQVTDHPTGIVSGGVTPDGEHVVWFADDRGDEVGHWLRQPFAGGDAEPVLPGLPAAWSAGLGLGPDNLVVLGLAGRDGFSIHVGRLGAESHEFYRHTETAHVAALSRDGRILTVSHCEHGDTLHPALRAYDTASGARLADLWDGPGNAVHAAGASPVAGDGRVAVLHERSGVLRPAIWEPATEGWTDLPVDLPGEVDVAAWWPDASALLLVHNHLGRDELWRLDLEGGGLERLEHPAGSIAAARVRPDGSVWYRHSSGALPAAVRSIPAAYVPAGRDGNSRHGGQPGGPAGTEPGVPAGAAAGAAPGSDAGHRLGEVVLAPPGPVAPPGVPYQSWAFSNDTGDRVHGFLALPERAQGGGAPFPTVILVHGGPHHQDRDSFSPQVQAWVDHGWAVALVNYRGSTGYGKRWQDALQGDPGRPEVADVAAARADLVARGIADPDRVVVAGASWGGYVTLMVIGTAPDGWRAALAVVPVADYEAAYADESEELQAFDRSLFGGSPDEVGTLYHERSPITYAEHVRTPVLLMVGENDTRCPLRQVLNYADRLRALGVSYELDRFDAGHGALVTAERVRQMTVELDFAARHVPGTSPVQLAQPAAPPSSARPTGGVLEPG